jgi:hypothetical protein
MPNTKAWHLKWIAFGSLVLLAAIQFWYVWQDYAKELWPNVLSYVPTLERSEILVVGANDARYLRFLDLYLPEDAIIVGAPVRQFSSQNRMQWFLLPRNTNVACGDGFTAACLALINDPSTVVPAIQDFPPMQDIPGKVFIPYPFSSKDLHGVFVPAAMASQLEVPAAEQFANAPVRSPRYFAQDLFIFSLLFVLGALVLALILVFPSWLDYLSLSLPLALAVLTWVIFLTSWLGIPITRISVGLYLALLTVFALLANRRWNRSWLSFPSIRLNLRQSDLPRSLLEILLAILLIALFCLAAAIAIGRSFSAFDEIANWGLKGYAMAQFGTIRAGATFGGHVLSCPLNIPLSIALFRVGDGDLIPGSKLIFPILAAGLFIQIYAFLRRHGVSTVLILASGLFLFTVPDLFRHSTLAFANLPLTAYLIPAAFWTIDGILERRTRWIFLGGVLFACAAWTRPEGIGLALLLLVGIYSYLFARRRKFPQPTLLACSLAPMMLPLL